MEAFLKAGVFFHDSVVRYAEIAESDQSAPELKRLGSCRFDFSVIDALQTGDEESIATLREALADVFSASTPDVLCVAIDPDVCLTFRTFIDSDTSDEAMRWQVLEEMSLIAGSETPLHVSSGAIGSETTTDGHVVSHLQVVAIPDVVRARLEAVLSNLSPETQFFSSVQGAGMLLHRFVSLRPDLREDSNSFSLAVGQYSRHFEYAVCRSGQLLHMQHVHCTDAQEGLYFGADLVRRLGGSQSIIDEVFLYGEDLSDESVVQFQSVLGNASLLDPLQVAQAPASPEGFDGRSFVQCVGVALSLPN